MGEVPGVVPALIGAMVVVTVNMGLFAVAWGRLQEQAKATDSRLARIEQHMGIQDGQAAFVRKGECPLVEQAVHQTLGTLNERMGRVEAEVHTIRLAQQQATARQAGGGS